MKTKLVFATLLLTSRLMAADATAPRRPAADAPPARAQTGAVGAVGSLGGAGAFDRVLTDEQRQKLREYMQANVEKLRTSQQQMMALRRELQESVVSGKADDAFIKQKSEAIAKLEAEILAARMSAMAKVAATLTPEQKEQIKEASEQLRTARPGLGAGPREGTAPRVPREPAAPPPPEK